jgi:BirA family transcriptional regulator, biotin operon repressor / biotin---[acetyl-CoA-carboxylase] ligase
MDQASLESTLTDVNLPAIRFFPSIGSTNDEAWRWIDAGAPHGALIIADEQTAGRGRFQRHWVTTRGSGLAFSLILLSPPLDTKLVNRLTGLGAVAVCQALRLKYTLPATIKWPNDILLNQRKVAGILVEARWNGEDLKAVIIGIGINIAPESISQVNLPAEDLHFPATCVENELGHPLDRLELLSASLQEFFSRLPRLSSQDFIQEWEDCLAYHDQWVELSVVNTDQSSTKETTPPPIQVGKVIGLTGDGSLKLLTRSGRLVTAQVGEIHLRPASVGDPSLPSD